MDGQTKLPELNIGVDYGMIHQLCDEHFIALAMWRRLTFIRRDWWKSENPNQARRTLPGVPVFELARSGTYEGIHAMDDLLLLIELNGPSASVSISIAAPTPDHPGVETLTATLRALLPSKVEPGRVPVLFWYRQEDCGAESARRVIDAPDWPAIASNYAAATREGLASLIDGFNAGDGGNFLLWHGQPGTGKTFALRALGRAWKEWCSTEFVTDPERFFGDAGYMMQVLLGGSSEYDDDLPPWRLLVLEDTGELLSADAKMNQGQRLSRFLNIADGMLGQGMRTLILVTTNEPVGSLHPAVSRPGRCASLVEFAPLNGQESTSWLRDHGGELTLNRSATLAELYSLIRGEQNRATPTRRPVGFSV